MKQGVVQIGGYYTGWVKYSDQQNRQKSPQLAHCPRSIREKPMIGIVGSPALRVGKRQNACDRPSGRAKYPAGDQTHKNVCCWSSENWKKLLNYAFPCRNNCGCIHANLPVVSFSIRSSDGWHFSDDISVDTAKKFQEGKEWTEPMIKEVILDWNLYEGEEKLPINIEGLDKIKSIKLRNWIIRTFNEIILNSLDILKKK